MQINKALIIADPWIGYILNGSKTWEMRASSTSHRGWFGLIRKGTGAIYGVARLVDVGAPLNAAEMVRTTDHHRIPADLIESGVVAKWNTPWRLADVRPLTTPVPYGHPSGAVTWVTLGDNIAEAIASQLNGLRSVQTATNGPVHQAAPISQARVPPAPAASSPVRLGERHSTGAEGEIRIEINEANLRNNHFYLRDHVHKFPNDVIGGSNKSKLAKRAVRLDWGGAVPVETDIDGEDKKFFRARGWIGAFFKLNGAQPGDFVTITNVQPYRYRIGLEKGQGSAGKAASSEPI